MRTSHSWRTSWPPNSRIVSALRLPGHARSGPAPLPADPNRSAHRPDWPAYPPPDRSAAVPTRVGAPDPAASQPLLPTRLLTLPEDPHDAAPQRAAPGRTAPGQHHLPPGPPPAHAPPHPAHL